MHFFSRNICVYQFFVVPLHPLLKFAVTRSSSASDATVAQLVEQRIRNAWVGGSSPPSGSKTDV